MSTLLYIPAPRRTSAIRDSDYVYSYQLRRLSEYNSDLQILVAPNALVDARTYFRLALALLRRRYKMPVPRDWSWHLSQYFHMPSKPLMTAGVSAILAYERYPKRPELPVLWITGPTELAKLRDRGWSDKQIQKEIDFKRTVNAQAGVTILTTPVKKAEFDEVIQPTRPTIVIPFFQPIERISNTEFDKKWDDLSHLRLLFVGRAAYRKGLPLVLDAYARLQKRYPGRTSLHIVSRFADGALDLPNLPGITREAEVSHKHSLDLMRTSHYLLMPSAVESYGWVYTEAMSQGAIPLAANAEVQRDLLDDGTAGWVVPRNADVIADAIGQGVEAPDSARLLARGALHLWDTRFAPELVASRFAEVATALRSGAVTSTSRATRTDRHPVG
jgi:glycosyltransferase involved in cell wall biosynthesis